MKAVGLAFITYCALATLLFDSIFKPVLLLMSWSDRFGVPWWPMIVAGCVAGAALVFALPVRGVLKTLRLSAFVAIAMSASVLFVGLYADSLRREAIARFDPDVSFQNSFFQSLRIAPEEFQFTLHAGAMKNCVPYGWSYRTMSFYRIPRDAAINVLSSRWLEPCGIFRGSNRLHPDPSPQETHSPG